MACDNNDERLYSFPNPSKESFQLILKNPSMIGEAQLTMTDLNGKPVLQKKITIEEGINLYHINTSTWTPGLYMVRIIGSTSELYLKHSVYD